MSQYEGDDICSFQLQYRYKILCHLLLECFWFILWRTKVHDSFEKLQKKTAQYIGCASGILNVDCKSRRCPFCIAQIYWLYFSTWSFIFKKYLHYQSLINPIMNWWIYCANLICKKVRWHFVIVTVIFLTSVLSSSFCCQKLAFCNHWITKHLNCQANSFVLRIIMLKQ